MSNWRKYEHHLRPDNFLEPFVVKSASLGIRVVRFETGKGNIDIHTLQTVDDATHILKTRLI